MSADYFIKGDKCYMKEGNSTKQVGKSGAVHVSAGNYDGKDAYVITYSDGKAFMTLGNATSEVRPGSKLGNKIVSTQFNQDGIILIFDNTKRYFQNKKGGKAL